MRIGLFTEFETVVPRSHAATLQALGDNRPHDVTIEHYSTPPHFAGLRAARQILRRAAADRLDLLHVATSGPLGVAALIFAARSRLPMILSCDSPAPCASAIWKSCVRTLARRLLSLELGLRRTRPMHQLIVVGDGPARHEIQARCPNAIFTGVIAHAEMPAVLASGDLYVCPSDAVSTNLAVLEAQASGLPVVVMENGSARVRDAPGLERWVDGGVRRIPRRGGDVSCSARSRASLRSAEPTPLVRIAR